jgi:hypothetical protein
MKHPFFVLFHAYENQTTKTHSPQSIHACSPHFVADQKSFWIHLSPLGRPPHFGRAFHPVRLSGGWSARGLF